MLLKKLEHLKQRLEYTFFFSFFSLFGNKLKSLRLHHHQFAPFEIYDDDALDNFIRGLVTQSSQEMDSSFSKEVSLSLAKVTCLFN